VLVVNDLTPQFRVRYSQGECGGTRELLDGRDFRLHYRQVCDFFGCNLPPRLVDLLRVAMSVYVIDRRTRRRSPDVPDGWSRSFRVRLEVLDPEFWQTATALHTLTRCVEFVSGDRWDFEFVRDEAGPRPYDVARDLFQPEAADGPEIVTLHSSGLDSAAGLTRRLMERPGRRFLPVTVTHQSQLPGNVQAQLSAIRRRLGGPLSHLMVQAEMRQPSRNEEEKSQRSRAFLFACGGGIVAALNGSAEVEVYESGVGAVNLPLYDWMVGSLATKSSHPYFLRLASRLVSLAAGRDITFRLPFLDQTKAQVVRSLAGDRDLEDLARSTTSCVHYPLREKRHKQCGFCPACVLRRQAMAVAGIAERADAYKYDLFNGGQLREMKEKRLRPLVAFLLQAERLTQLDRAGAPPDFFRHHLRETEVVRPGEPPGPYVELYRRYRDEWLGLAERCVRLGFPWTVPVARRKAGVA
jgi:hypothetical protein